MSPENLMGHLLHMGIHNTKFGIGSNNIEQTNYVQRSEVWLPLDHLTRKSIPKGSKDDEWTSADPCKTKQYYLPSFPQCLDSHEVWTWTTQKACVLFVGVNLPFLVIDCTIQAFSQRQRYWEVTDTTWKRILYTSTAAVWWSIKQQLIYKSVTSLFHLC